MKHISMVLIIAIFALSLLLCGSAGNGSQVSNPDTFYKEVQAVKTGQQPAKGGLTDFLSKHGLLDRIEKSYLKEYPNRSINSEFWSYYSHCGRDDYLLNGDTVSVIHILLSGHNCIYLNFVRENGKKWALKSVLPLNYYGYAGYRMEYRTGYGYWFVTAQTVDHGTQYFEDEVWYNLDGSKALTYSSGGYCYTGMTNQTSRPCEISYIASLPPYSSGNTLNTYLNNVNEDGGKLHFRYDVTFLYDTEGDLSSNYMEHSVNLLEYMTYKWDMKKKIFSFLPEESTMPAKITNPDYENSPVLKKYAPVFYGVNAKKKVTPEEFVKIINQQQKTIMIKSN